MSELTNFNLQIWKTFRNSNLSNSAVMSYYRPLFKVLLHKILLHPLTPLDEVELLVESILQLLCREAVKDNGAVSFETMNRFWLQSVTQVIRQSYDRNSPQQKNAASAIPAFEKILQTIEMLGVNDRAVFRVSIMIAGGNRTCQKYRPVVASKIFAVRARIYEGLPEQEEAKHLFNQIVTRSVAVT